MTPVCSLSVRTHAYGCDSCRLREGLGTHHAILVAVVACLPVVVVFTGFTGLLTHRYIHGGYDKHARSAAESLAPRAGANKWEAASNTSGKQCLVKLNCRERRRRRRRREGKTPPRTPFGTAAWKSFPTQSRRFFSVSAFFCLHRLFIGVDLYGFASRERRNFAAPRETRQEWSPRARGMRN